MDMKQRELLVHYQDEPALDYPIHPFYFCLLYFFLLLMSIVLGPVRLEESDHRGNMNG